jgi:ATP-dependent Lon protease
VSGDGTVGLYRVEVSLSSGTGKLKPAGGVSGAMKESVNRAFSYLSGQEDPLWGARDLDTSDLHVEVIDLLGNRVEAELGVAFFVAAYSALRKAPSQPALLVLGDLSVQGNIKPVRSLTEPLQVAMDNGGKRALIPIENKRQFPGRERGCHGAGRPHLLRRYAPGGIQGAGADVTRCRAFGAAGHRPRVWFNPGPIPATA